MKQLLPQKFHTYIYIFALILLVIGMPLSKFLMSLSQIILFCNWVLEGNLKNKMQLFLKNKPALVLCSLLILHLLALAYTSDFKYAADDIRIKAPLLVLPLILSTSIPLNKKTVDAILRFLVAAVFVATTISMFVLFGFTKHQVVDIRDISIFISHIRFALLICFSLFTCIYLYLQEEKKYVKSIYVVCCMWFLIFLAIMESVTGITALVFATSVIVIYKLWISKKTILKLLGASSIIAGIVAVFVIYFQIKNFSPENHLPDPATFEKYTANGNEYMYDANGPLKENGNFVWTFVCDKELRQEWNKRSKLDYDGNDLKENKLAYTLVRFLASKGLKKDSIGMSALSDNEIKAIERGVANTNNQNISDLKGRIQETIWEVQLYLSTGDANGHSLTQRFEYWKAAFHVFKNNPVLGVGTGDVELELNKEYDIMQSKLKPEYRLRAHNQYLTFALTFGIVGLILFLITLIYPAIALNKHTDLLYIAFLSIAMFSFLNEDTLETQAGVTFFAFLNSFLLFLKKE
jgi:hypothetical protein